MIRNRLHTAAWFPLRHHPVQAALAWDRVRFPVVVAGRGSGKSEVARRFIVGEFLEKRRWPTIYVYALPTYSQAKRIAWGPIKALCNRRLLEKTPSESELMIETAWGNRLYLIGMDRPERMEGWQIDGSIIDECSDQKPGAFDRTVLPTLSHRSGWCWRIGVPKRFGVGARQFKEAFDAAVAGKDPESKAYTWPSSDILTADQLRFARENLDEVDYLEQYGALWERAGGLVFHAFDPGENVSTEAEYNPELPIVVGSDFNVDPMCWVLGHFFQRERLVHVFDEIVLRNTNTSATLDRLARKYGSHQGGWWFCGDATGQARKTSAAKSDYLQIKADKRFLGARVHYPTANPPQLDRFAACNAMLKNAEGERRCKVHPRCAKLIDDLSNRAYKEGTREPDDGHDTGHASDAFGYPIHRFFPLSVKLGGSPSVYAGD